METNEHGVVGTVLVAGVGAVNGLGFSLAKRFAEGGYSVVIAGRNRKKVEAAADALREAGHAVRFVIGDVSVADDARAFVEEAISHGPLSVVIHNAGSNVPSPFLQVTEQDFEAHWREHTLGGFQLAQAALPRLLEQSAGTLIFTGASGSLRGKANYSPFAAAKSGLRALVQSLAREFGPQGIHVGHVIIDGGIDGERLLTMRPGLKEQRGPDGMLNTDAIAEAYWNLHKQHRSAWTLELDLRPWVESF